MRILIESTDKLTAIDGVAVRWWQGCTEDGVHCHVFVHRIAVREDFDCEEFEAALKEMDPPSGPSYLPLARIL